jgi:hypothetical protein
MTRSYVKWTRVKSGHYVLGEFEAKATGHNEWMLKHRGKVVGLGIARLQTAKDMALEIKIRENDDAVAELAETPAERRASKRLREIAVGKAELDKRDDRRLAEVRERSVLHFMRMLKSGKPFGAPVDASGRRNLEEAKRRLRKEKIDIVIHGPNLTDQSKGQFHVHTVDCQDNKHYGRGKYGGETGWVVKDVDPTDVERQVAENIYGDFEEYDENPDSYLGDAWIAPCIKR